MATGKEYRKKEKSVMRRDVKMMGKGDRCILNLEFGRKEMGGIQELKHRLPILTRLCIVSS